MPSVVGEEDFIVIKLDSGYNIGLPKKKVKKTEIISETKKKTATKKKAEQTYREVVKRRPKNAKARARLGSLLFKKGDLKGAEKELIGVFDVHLVVLVGPVLPGPLWPVIPII